MSKKSPTILAIETSADETSAAIIHGGKLSSNVVYSQIAEHKKTGGIVPEVAARAHIPKIIPAIKEALTPLLVFPLSKGGGWGVALEKVDAIAVTVGPGLITSLIVGIDTAKTLSFALNKPIIPINHMEGHLLSALPSTKKSKRKMQNAKLFPAIGLVVSGGHTMLVHVKGIGKYKILGETLDDAAGEAFDKIAKILGLPYPGGPAVAHRATKFKAKNAKLKIELPRPLIHSQNYNFSFSGLKTAALYKVNELQKNKNFNDAAINHVAHETQQAIVDVLVAKTIRAAKEFKAKTVLLGGGVAANKKLRQSLKNAVSAALPDSKFMLPDTALTTDNAGMIAKAAHYHYIYGKISTYKKIKPDPNLKLKSWR